MERPYLSGVSSLEDLLDFHHPQGFQLMNPVEEE